LQYVWVCSFVYLHSVPVHIHASQKDCLNVPVIFLLR
jgi:hypothetical protein